MSADDDGYQEKSYIDQKREVLEVLSEYIEKGNKFINETMHREEDRREVELVSQFSERRPSVFMIISKKLSIGMSSQILRF